MANSYTRRKHPAATGDYQNFGVLSYTDIVGNATDGEVSLVNQQFAPYGYPLQLIQICSQKTASGTSYPDDGDGLLDGGSTSTVTVDTNIKSEFDATGMLVVMLNGNEEGEVRRITNYVSGTGVATVHRNYDTGPTTGDKYALLIDAWTRNRAIIKPEFSVSDTAKYVSVSIGWFDYARVPDASETLRAPVRWQDRESTLMNLGINPGPVEETNYYHGQSLAVDTLGSIGFKVHVTGISTTTTFSLWAGAI